MPKSARVQNPLIVQSDRTLLVEASHPAYDEVRQQLCHFAERVKSPAYLHTYRITPYTLWNAAARNLSAEWVIERLENYSKLPVPPQVVSEIKQLMNRYGMLRFEPASACSFYLTSVEAGGLERILQHIPLHWETISSCDKDKICLPLQIRGIVKQACMRAGYPVIDEIGFQEGEPLSIRLSANCEKGSFRLRDYQRQAVETFYCEGSVSGGNGIVVLPCGAGKTVVGIGVMEKVGKATLILTPSATSAKQWIREILDKTGLPPELIGEYTATDKQVRPVTVTTYQMMTHRTEKEGPFHHMKIFSKRDWGLIIYDEVHLLPAPVFRATADLQAKRRLGLTATLIREDGREGEVFSLIGPKKFEVSWGELEKQGWISEAVCVEIRVPFSKEERDRYHKANQRQKYRLAAENEAKYTVIDQLLKQHNGEQILIIGQYLNQLRMIARRYHAPLITGHMKQDKRDEWFSRFRRGEVPILVVSKVANFAVDLPDASIAIQVSGAFGSRQEEAQRLGRILRPKQTEKKVYFYHVVTSDTIDQEYAWNRQLFLAEQGYHYQIREVREVKECGS
ncbi:DNA repair helicase XPB [Paenactinomyces guangxiensis]|uniref:DNA 3'-5' helicase n=1 Tax=Paenactinomyces guangxiensis TaxID=1490290 RepID=A0A7W1WNA9_9BACL|nr:DNA repair helicase XPB [Paenactinomyces guangxiensis]MBA4492913.1 DEAD/DEAH box helicase [Paenactinomyces guangxiensis]MBH8590238.1 DEAD/DEAH box helicase [Paenactinomyces guangxiensis]